MPEGALYGRCRDWIVQTFDRAGFEIDMGGKVFATFLAAGLPAPEMIAAARVGGGPDAFAYEYIARTLESLLPMMARLGVASAAEIGIDTLAGRLRQEALEQRASIMSPPMIGAWTRMPKHLNDSESMDDE